MRTHTFAAALLVALAACGGGDGLSLTEPGQIDLAACEVVSADLTGRWIVGEWGCVGKASPGGAIDCEPDALPWADGALITMAVRGPDSYTIDVDGGASIAFASGATEFNADFPVGSMTIGACSNGKLLILFGAETGSTFAAYAHR